jgi:hypothetical protein
MESTGKEDDNTPITSTPQANAGEITKIPTKICKVCNHLVPFKGYPKHVKFCKYYFYKWQHLRISNVDVPNLPEEMWCLIFSYLPTESKKYATATCQVWFKIIRSDPKLSGHISVSLAGIQNENWNWENWPSLRILEIDSKGLFWDSSKTSYKEWMENMKELNFGNCQNLETVIVWPNRVFNKVHREIDLAEITEEISVLNVKGTVNSSTLTKSVEC